MYRLTIPLARFAIFVIYFWFGLLKVLGESPATPMVQTLFENTVAKFTGVISFDQFIILFGLFEMVIGIIFLIPRWEKIATVLLALHIVTTTMPLFVLKDMLWTKAWVPTMEGQYIIKNIAIVALALSIFQYSRNR